MHGIQGDEKQESIESPSQDSHAQNTPSDSQFNIEAPSINLPKGGGAIRGIGEKFAANPVSGTGSMSIPIATSPGRSGFGPELSLSYDSGAGNGIFGFGWDLSLPSITRKTDKGLPRYHDTTESDVFILSGAEDLVPELDDSDQRKTIVSDDGQFTIYRYRPRNEGLFARIERWARINDGDTHWRSISKDNILTIYGKNSDSRIADPEAPDRIFSWLICETRDDKGNAVVYEYKPDDGVGVNTGRVHERNRGDRDDPRRSANRYLKRIFYGNIKSLLTNGQRPRFLNDNPPNTPDWMFEVVFDYGEHDELVPQPDEQSPWPFRADPFSTFRPGFEVRTTRLCQRVLMFHHFSDDGSLIGAAYDGLVRSTDFTYSHQQYPQNPKNPVYTFLLSASQAGYKRKDGQANVDYIKRSLPPVEFEYSQPVVQDTVEDVDPSSLENLPIGVDGSAYQWVDLHSEGIPGILTEQAESWWYKRNISPVSDHSVEFTAVEQVESRPNQALAAGAQFMDFAGNGQLDLVMLDGPAPGLYEHDKQEDWQPYRTFTSRLNRNTGDPNLKFIDLDGDGHADVLITEDDAFIWHQSLEEAGFGPSRRVAQALDEEKGPRILFADGTQSIFLADISGDGLTDLIRIRNGEVCFWPNLGYCRFGTKITMDNAPHFDYPDHFEQGRLRLADIDGSGTIDIIYLHADGVRLYFNQSGNSWSEPQKLNVFPRIDEIVSIVPADLLGNGTACLVWSSPLPGDARHRMRHVNLMGAQKPHLLIKSKNNLGAETQVHYAPSTKFYLADKRAGKPWITKLPFPVHVVEKLVMTDKWRNTRFATTYSYHHGYFDGVEREFRGFGRVEQIDVETFGEFAAGNSNSPYITDDKTLYQPPIKTVSWFHTGAALDRKIVLSQFEKEYFKIPGGFEENKLPEPDLQRRDLTTEEWRQAMRACKGLPLRQEVYELDVDVLEQGEHKPVRLFSTAFNNCNIKMLQSKANNLYAVFLVTESEAISYQYDLDLLQNNITADPRISHTLNLKIDEFGNVLQSVAAVYPRIGTHIDATLPANGQALITRVQNEMHLAYNETRFTNDVDNPVDLDNYRLRLPCEVLTYELTGIDPADSIFNLRELKKQWLSKVYQDNGIKPKELAYHQIPDGNNFEKRLVEHVRMLFFDQNLTGPFEFRKLNALALPFETYKLALTDQLLDAIFSPEQLTNAIRIEIATADKSGYINGATLAARFAGEDTRNQYWVRSGIAGFADDADDHFFLPKRFTDPFGNSTVLEYDRRDLFIKSSIDPVENTVSVVNFDYRVLSPLELNDINDNRSAVVFDVLGLPVVMATKGKQRGSQWQGDNLDDLTDELLYPAHADVVAFCTNAIQDNAQARQWLGNATSRFVYHFGETIDAAGQITWGARMSGACSIAREKHVGQMTPQQTSPLQVALECSDGGGNVLMQKAQAEPDPATGNSRWLINGLTVLNNKGKPVKQFEPAFTDRFGCELPQANGVTAVIYYDSADRVVRTELPDGSYSRTDYTSWHVTSFDQNDTVLEPNNAWFTKNSSPNASPEQQRAAQQAAAHASTPAQVFLDSLGRDVISVEDNKDEKYVSFTRLDAEGKPLWIRDARGNLVMQYISPPKANNTIDDTIPANSTPCYDIAGNLLFQHSMDGGDRWMISDATAQPYYAWDANENETGVLEDRVYHTIYDELRRPLEKHLLINNGLDQLIEKFVYGESQQDSEARNLNGQLYQNYDSSGLVTNEEFEFSGNLLEAKRELISFTEESITDWTNIAAISLDEPYIQSTQYDALNRMTRHENWHIQGRNPAIYQPQYNQRGLLLSESLTVENEITSAIVNIDYDAKGQRQTIEYGNNTVTVSLFDPDTFRLLNLTTIQTQTNRQLQNLNYNYDPVGNITEISDKAQQIVFFNNQQVTPDSKYEYDALYRLVKAQGREHVAQNNVQRDNTPFKPQADITFPHSPVALQRYTETYDYDKVGNILNMTHGSNEGTQWEFRWKRFYQYALDSNRLLATSKAGDDTNNVEHYAQLANVNLSAHYQYDTHGSMLNLNRSSEAFNLHWDSNGMIHHINLGGGGDAFYDYGSDKERSRKRIIKNNGNIIEERLYLGGMERYRRWLNGDLKEEIETYHVFDGEQRALMVENVLLTDNQNLVKGILFRYQYGNHLGSVSLELDELGKSISYEEYHPYGTTAFSAKNSGVRAAKKRYRYTGMERDEESGLSYHSARYYLPWLGRWGSADPSGISGGINLYAYGAINPFAYVDTSGNAPKRYEDQRGKDTAAKRKEMEKNLNDAKKKGHTPDPMQKRAKKLAKQRGKTPIEQHHHRGVKESAKVKLAPKKMGKPMSSLWSTKRDPIVQGSIDGKPRTHHNVAKHLDMTEQAKVPKTAAGLEQASEVSKKRLPATVDMTERAKMDWTRSSPTGPSVNPRTGKVKPSKLAGFGKKLAKLGPLGTAVGVGTAVFLLAKGEPMAAVRELAGALPVVGEILDVIEVGTAIFKKIKNIFSDDDQASLEVNDENSSETERELELNNELIEQVNNDWDDRREKFSVKNYYTVINNMPVSIYEHSELGTLYFDASVSYNTDGNIMMERHPILVNP